MERQQQVLFPFSKVAKGASIVLYGAGDVGQTFHRQVEKTGYCRIVAWADRRFAGMRGLPPPLTDPAAIAGLVYDQAVIAVSDPEICGEIAVALAAAGVPEEKIVRAADCLLGFTLCHLSDVESAAGLDQNEAFARLLAGSIGSRWPDAANASGERAGPAPQPADRVYNIGIVGTGLMSRHMADAVGRRLGNARIHAVVSRDRRRAETFAVSYGVPRAYGSCEELAADREVDLVYIATPDRLHHPQTLFFLERGKHVLCEKPFALNAGQAREMIGAARSRGLLVADGMWPCYLPMARVIRDIARSGVLGRVSALTGNLYYIGNPDRAKSGIFLSNGIYLLSLATLAFGTGVSRLAASAALTKAGLDEQTSVTLFYGDAMATLTCGLRAASDRRACLYGDKAFAVIDNANEYKSVDVFSVSPQLEVPNRLIASHAQQSGYDHEMKACLAAIERGDCEPAEWPHAETLAVMDLLDAVHREIDVKY
jgi:predicted dehydrogenase